MAPRRTERNAILGIYAVKLMDGTGTQCRSKVFVQEYRVIDEPPCAPVVWVTSSLTEFDLVGVVASGIAKGDAFRFGE
jgi:hypothetical protein